MRNVLDLNQYEQFSKSFLVFCSQKRKERFESCKIPQVFDQIKKIYSSRASIKPRRDIIIKVTPFYRHKNLNQNTIKAL